MPTGQVLLPCTALLAAMQLTVMLERSSLVHCLIILIHYLVGLHRPSLLELSIMLTKQAAMLLVHRSIVRPQAVTALLELESKPVLHILYCHSMSCHLIAKACLRKTGHMRKGRRQLCLLGLEGRHCQLQACMLKPLLLALCLLASRMLRQMGSHKAHSRPA